MEGEEKKRDRRGEKGIVKTMDGAQRLILYFKYTDSPMEMLSSFYRD